MIVYLSSLTTGIEGVGVLIDIARSFPAGRVGIDLFAHTQDSEYMEKLEQLETACEGLPILFQGPCR